MTAIEKKEFDNFNALINHWINAYAWCVYSYVALKTNVGYRLLFGRVIFETSGFVQDKKDFNFETAHIRAGQFAVKIGSDTIATVLENAKKGEFALTDGILQLSVQQNHPYSIYFYPIYHPFIKEGPRLPSLIIRGDTKHDLFMKSISQELVDWDLKAANSPFFNIDELLSHCGLPLLNQMGDSTTYEIIARSPAFIVNTSIIKDGKGLVECNISNGLDIKKLKVGYKLPFKDLNERGSIIGDALKISDGFGFKKCLIEIPVKDAAVMQVFLSYSDFALHQWWIFDRDKQLNPRYSIHQVIDPQLELLKETLFKPNKNMSFVFENAVSNLLNLLGFSASNYGRIPKLQDGPDIIAVTPAGHIGVVECTTGLLDENDKLAKLVLRTKLIKEKLETSGYGYLKIQPIIVTPLTRKAVAANLENAGKHGIAVMCKENIENLMQQLILPPNPERLFEEAKELIPTID